MKKALQLSPSLILGLVLASASLCLAATPSIVQPSPVTQDNLPLKKAEQITTFSLLQSGWIGVSAAVGDLRENPLDYRSAFDLSSVEEKDGYISVPLIDNEMKIEIATAGSHVAVYRFTFPESEKGSHFVLDISHPLDQFRGGKAFERDRETVEGFGTYQTEDGDEQTLYFSFQTSHSYAKRGVWTGDTEKETNSGTVKDNSTLGFYGYFNRTYENQTILMKVGVSTLSIDDARAKLNEQFPGWDFNQLRRDAN